MVREHLLLKDGEIKKGFFWRGQQVSRVEGFSDAVFAFALTLLVVSLEIPRNFGELMTLMRGFLAFAICFAMLCGIWYSHYIFFRRYGLDDVFTVVLNAILLFVILFYVYPLKFLFTLLIDNFMGMNILPQGVITNQQMPQLMLIYSFGIVAVFSIFILMYIHAYRKREELELTETEKFITWTSIFSHGISAGIGLLSIGIAVFLPTKYIAWSGLIYFLMGPCHAAWGMWSGSRVVKLKEATATGS